MRRNDHVSTVVWCFYAAMFDDSLAPSYTPSDLFHPARNARLIVPYRSGYLVEMAADQLAAFAGLVQRTDLVKDQVDISRIEAIRYFESEDTAGTASLDEIWEAAPETEGGKAFTVWLMPLRGREASEELIQRLIRRRDDGAAPEQTGNSRPAPGRCPAPCAVMWTYAVRPCSVRWRFVIQAPS